ncbi:unnamed protein product [Malus baccata var. baccata]
MNWGMNWGMNWEEIKEKSRVIDGLWAQEESYWQQRSRVKWLREGDANTTFFHQSTLQQRRRNKVLKIKDGNGDWVDNPIRVRQLVDDHFIQVFTSGGNRNWGTLLDCVNPTVTEMMNLMLTAPVLEEEVKDAALHMGGLKAPGPDGFQGVFYQSFWEYIVRDVNELIKSLILGQDSPCKLNSTHIVLIPKVQNPETVTQFRPISLCNYSYKVLSKVLVNRLKPIMPTLISSSQNAFVAGRQIQDNIGIAHELCHFLKVRKTKSKFELGIKLDMQKAYDRVEWDFLEAVMERMGFSDIWRKLIMGCVTSVNFAVILNRMPGNKFAPSRGLRQGDPLSPFLFLLVGEVLSRLIQDAIDKRMLKGVKMNVGGPVISHILFADDTLIFLKANKKNCRNLVKLLEAYCLASGQGINAQKSCVFFGANTPEAVSTELGLILAMPVVNNPGSYLGVPAVWGRSKSRGLAYVNGRLLGKLQGWIQSTLSRAGKEVLIKAVAQAIPAYPMNIFKFPTSVCNEMDALIARFWWGDMGGGRKIHWVSMETLGLQKRMGGLGFRSFQEFNVALLAKQCWRLINEPDSLWAMVLEARYFPNCSFFDARKGGRASWAWSSLLAGRDLILQGAHKQIMGGDGVRVWVDIWLPSLPFGHPSPSGGVTVTRNTRVSSLICQTTHDWDITFLNPFLSSQEQSAILETPIGNSRRNDRLVWADSRNGKFSVRSGYHWLQVRSISLRDHRHPSVRVVPEWVWNAIWKVEVPAKMRHFLWTTVHNAIATKASLYRCRSSTTPLCLICNCNEETIKHLLLLCPWVGSIWLGGALKYNVNCGRITSWVLWLQSAFEHNLGSDASRSWVQAYVVFSCWHIWKTRCEFVFNNLPINSSKVLMVIHNSMEAFSEARRESGAIVTANSNRVGIVSSWSPPAAPFCKSKFANFGFVGVVVRNAVGEFVAAARYAIAASSAALAEAYALLRGCEVGSSLGLSSVIFESDSLESIFCLTGSMEDGSWEAFPTLVRVMELGKTFQNCRWSWVPRSANVAADSLASTNNQEMCDIVWVDRPPSSLVHVLNNDGLPLVYDTPRPEEGHAGRHISVT